MQLNEDSLKGGDLRDLVNHIFEVDCYKSKMGDDKDVVVLSFTVESKDPATDLVNFIEKGYEFVLDADMTPGELANGKYQVFVELQRTPHVPEQIKEMLYGIGKLTNIENFKFRYHKSFNSIDATEDQLSEMIPSSPTDYETKLQERTMESYDQFFAKSMLESISMEGDILYVKKIYADPLKFKILSSGNKKSVVESIEDKINVNEWAEIIFLTKYFGDFNITKFGNKLMFEDKGHAVLLEKL